MCFFKADSDHLFSTVFRKNKKKNSPPELYSTWLQAIIYRERKLAEDLIKNYFLFLYSSVSLSTRLFLRGIIQPPHTKTLFVQCNIQVPPNTSSTNCFHFPPFILSHLFCTFKTSLFYHFPRLVSDLPLSPSPDFNGVTVWCWMWAFQSRDVRREGGNRGGGGGGGGGGCVGRTAAWRCGPDWASGGCLW